MDAPDRNGISLRSARKFVTITEWLPSYSFTSARKDLTAGLTVSVILIPQAMAYAMLAGIPPIYGLYAALVPLLVYPIFGTSRHIALGVTAIDALIISAGVSMIALPQTDDYLALVILLALLTGLIQLLLGIFRLGFVVNLLSEPVITGFTAAAAITISISQIQHITGLDVPRTEFLYQSVLAILSTAGNIHPLTLLIGMASIAVMVLMKRFTPRLPAALVAVVLATLAVWWLKLDAEGVRIVGDIDGRLPGFSSVQFSALHSRELLPTALTLALVQFMTIISLGKVYAARHRYIIKPNRELVALGLANVSGSFFRSMPISASFSRSAINARAGSVTPAANMFAAFAVAFALLFLTGLFFYLPIAVLGAIIIVSVLGLIDIQKVRFLFKVKLIDGLIAVATFLITLIVGITEGVLAGIAISVVAIMYRISRPNVAELGHLPGTRSFRDIMRHPEAEIVNGIAILRIDASFTFANADFLRDMLLERSVLDEDLKHIVIDASTINDLDTSAAAALASAARTLKDRDIELYFGGVKDIVLDTMRLFGLVDLLGESHFFLSPHRAIKAIVEMREKESAALTSNDLGTDESSDDASNREDAETDPQLAKSPDESN